MIPDLTSIEIAPTIIYALKRAGIFFRRLFEQYLFNKIPVHVGYNINIVCFQSSWNCAFLCLHLVNG